MVTAVHTEWNRVRIVGNILPQSSCVCLNPAEQSFHLVFFSSRCGCCLWEVRCSHLSEQPQWNPTRSRPFLPAFCPDWMDALSPHLPSQWKKAKIISPCFNQGRSGGLYRTRVFVPLYWPWPSWICWHFLAKSTIRDFFNLLSIDCVNWVAVRCIQISTPSSVISNIHCVFYTSHKGCTGCRNVSSGRGGVGEFKEGHIAIKVLLTVCLTKCEMSYASHQTRDKRFVPYKVYAQPQWDRSGANQFLTLSLLQSRRNFKHRKR